MAQWEDDLRAVVEHRGAALLWHAHVLLDPVSTTVVTSDDDPAPGTAEDPKLDAALELTVDALASAFRRGARPGHGAEARGSVQLVTDDELDALEQAVRGAQERLAPARPLTFLRRADEPAPPDDGPYDALTARLSEVVARVRAARRRGRRRGWLAGAAAVVVVAVVTSAVAGWPAARGSADPTPTPSAYAGACGAPLPTGASLLPVVTADQDVWDRHIVAGQPWHGTYTGDPSSLTSDELSQLAALTPEVVLARGGRVVALGESTETYQDTDGSMSTAPPWPGIAGLSATALDNGYAPNPDTTPVDVTVRFAACDGRPLASGAYQAYLLGSNGDGGPHVLSDAADVELLASAPDGFQPAWLEGSALACGESVDEFLTRITTHPFVGLDTEGVTDSKGRAAVRLTNGADTSETTVLPTHAVVAWVKGSTIVGVGPDERGTSPTTIGPGKTVTLATRAWDTTDYCAHDGMTQKRLAPGTYFAFAYARFPAHDPSDPDRWVLQDMGTQAVVVHRDGSVSDK